MKLCTGMALPVTVTQIWLDTCILIVSVIWTTFGLIHICH